MNPVFDEVYSVQSMVPLTPHEQALLHGLVRQILERPSSARHPEGRKEDHETLSQSIHVFVRRRCHVCCAALERRSGRGCRSSTSQTIERCGGCLCPEYLGRGILDQRQW